MLVPIVNAREIKINKNFLLFLIVCSHSSVERVNKHK